MDEINKRDFKSFPFIWGRANREKANEHNVIVVTGDRDSSFQNGIVLDAWRDSGKLYFTRVKDDPDYKFTEWKKGTLKINNQLLTN